MSINYSLGRRWPVSTLLAPCVFGLQNGFSSQSLQHYTTLPIDRTNGYGYSYRSHTNKPFGSSPDFLTEHSAFLQVLGVIPDRRSLTSVVSSRELLTIFDPLSSSGCNSKRLRPIWLKLLWEVLWHLLSYILRTGSGQTDGRDVYGVTSRVLLMADLGEGTQLSRRPLMTYGSNVGAGEGCCIWLFLEVCALR